LADHVNVDVAAGQLLAKVLVVKLQVASCEVVVRLQRGLVNDGHGACPWSISG